MITEAVLAVALAATSDDRQPAPSRSSANRFMDSGHAIWSRTPAWIRTLGLCIARHESITSGHYRAENSQSTASGRYQMLTPMWQGNAKWFVSIKKYPTAGSAPRWAQDMAFINSIKHGGVLHWKGTHCGYGT